ncbi:hypothetical protein CJO71_30165 [Burkholderia ubonensis]|uniref:Uncharacterized protein n=1 Tax=Burkholderia ubonensis TaxID=101571 RepID=A0AB74D8W3_9BURK|nr:hypothetical protein [Burkholderia ubonensis]PAJ77395.1 hypothetical protein CJO71_30165 [Burkholderia ubonensis]RQP79383.1 hypothetical protein DF015_12335 [Burkholderia ubonensis]
MAKIALDNQRLEILAGRLQQLEALFESIQEEVTGSHFRACVLCDIGHDIAERVGVELNELRSVSRPEVCHG